MKRLVAVVILSVAAGVVGGTGVVEAALISQSGQLVGGALSPDEARDRRPLTAITNGCVRFPGVHAGTDDFDLGDCSPVQSGAVGHVDHRWYHYVLYCLLESRTRRKCDPSDTLRGVAIFVSDDDSAFVRPFLARVASPISGSIVEPPEIVTNSLGTFLQVNVDGGGTNRNEYYRWSP